MMMRQFKRTFYNKVMKKNMRHSQSLKSKNNGQIHLLEDKLFSKFQTTEVNEPKYDELEFKMLNDAPDALSQLIGRAKGITSQNQDKIQRAKKELRVSKKEAAGTFLTGTGIYAAQIEDEEPLPEIQPEPDIDPDDLLKDLSKKGDYDDLEQLRRMIKATGKNLDGYSRQVFQIKKDVMHAATQFKSQMDFNLSYQLNRLKQPSKKNQSVSRLRETRYN